MRAVRFPAGVALTFSLTSALLAPWGVEAQVERSGGGGVNQQLYQDYQQAIAERTQLRADNAKLKSNLADAQKQLAAARQQLAAAKSGNANDQAALAAAQAAQAAATKSLQALRGQTAELIDRFRQTIAQLRDVETDRTELRAQLAQSRSAYDQCAVANYNLYQVDSDVLTRYARQGVFSHLAKAEPFTRIERARIDNLVLQYRQRADELRVQRAAAAPAGGAPQAAKH